MNTITKVISRASLRGGEGRADIPPTRRSRYFNEWPGCKVEFSSASLHNRISFFVSYSLSFAIIVPLLNAQLSSPIADPTWKNNGVPAEIFSVALHDEVEGCEEGPMMR